MGREQSDQPSDGGNSNRMPVAQGTGSGVDLQSVLAALSGGQHGGSNPDSDIVSSLHSAIAELQRNGRGGFGRLCGCDGSQLSVIGCVYVKRFSARHRSWRGCHLEYSVA